MSYRGGGETLSPSPTLFGEAMATFDLDGVQHLRCSNCGFFGASSKFTLLAAGVDGVQEGSLLDLNAFECPECRHIVDEQEVLRAVSEISIREGLGALVLSLIELLRATHGHSLRSVVIEPIRDSPNLWDVSIRNDGGFSHILVETPEAPRHQEAPRKEDVTRVRRRGKKSARG